MPLFLAGTLKDTVTNYYSMRVFFSEAEPQSSPDSAPPTMAMNDTLLPVPFLPAAGTLRSLNTAEKEAAAPFLVLVFLPIAAALDLEVTNGTTAPMMHPSSFTPWEWMADCSAL